MTSPVPLSKVNQRRRCLKLSLQQLLLLCLAVTAPHIAIAQTGSRRAPEEMNPIVVAQEIKATDEKSVIQKLWQNKKNWTRFVNSIADGDQAWVDVGLLLLPHAAGLASRDLRLAFEDALIKSPITIVTAIGSHRLRTICSPRLRSRGRFYHSATECSWFCNCRTA